MSEPLSIWLVPQKEDEKYLSEIISDLGIEYDAPLFTPHLTLLGNLNIELNKLKNILDEVFANKKAFSIKKTIINHSEEFFKTIFIEFELNNDLKNLFIEVSNKTDNRDIATFKPHISLIYKTMPVDEKLKIIERLKIKEDFLIDKIYIQSPKIGDTDHHDVKNWRILYKKSLNSHLKLEI